MGPLKLAALAALVFLAGSGPSPDGSPSTSRALFCPECAKYCEEGCSPDNQGLCRGCGRRPLEVEACVLTWYWCMTHARWHEERCVRDPAVRCCSPRDRMALLVDADTHDLVRLRYCPECAKVCDEGCPIDSKGHCRACGRPTLLADTLRRTWYWCSARALWQDRECPGNASEGCCSGRTLRLLAVAGEARRVLFAASAHRMLVTTDWLEEHLADRGVAILHVGFSAEAPDAGERMAYNDGHIPGARPVEWSEIALTRGGIPNELPPVEELVSTLRRVGIAGNELIVLYDTGVGLEAARAYVALEYAGLGENAVLLDGQLRKWLAEGRATTAEPPEVEPSTITPRLHPEFMVSLQTMRDLVWMASQPESDVTIIDARTDEEYMGQKPGRGIKRPGHIPGAKNVCWMLNLESDENPVFRPVGDLMELYQTAGARPGQIVVVYCRSGVQASHAYFTLKFLGYDVRFYDGSYGEWSSNRELPVKLEVAK